jgi:glycosyltransferase involved in cell wall biosynthesis
MILSILIPTLENREHLFTELLNKLGRQIRDINAFDEIEILYNNKPKPLTTGDKRNELLNQSNGKYVIFIDDDDDISDSYLFLVYKACLTGMDCVSINGYITTDGKDRIDWRMSKDFNNETIKENNKDVYIRKANHLAAIKREFALLAGFPSKSNGEDKDYSDSVNKYLKTEYIIQEPIYHYRYSSYNKEYK